ncbi:MAG TPA: signal peptide peptidase SppA [Bryobacteraceae bacterium]|nr:signal peptide peptidase SppA [Bryobacteraceae bacterium]
MKNFFIGLVAGLLLAGLATLIFVFAMIRLASSFGARPVRVADGSTLVLKLEGDLPEKAPPEIPVPFFQAQEPLTVQELWQTFRRAAADSHIKAILFEPRGLSIGWAKMEELHDEILQFRKSGKPIITYLQNPGAREYYLAVATGRIFLMPEDSLDLKGLSAQSIFIKTTLDKIGVQAEVIHAGKYKDAGDALTRTSMTPETREVLNDVLDQYYGDLVDTIAKGRKKPADAVRALIDNGPYLANEALSNGLVDTLGYEEQAVQDLESRLKQRELKRISARSYLRAPLPVSGVTRRIAFVVGQGDITAGSGNDAVDEQNFSATAFIQLLKQVEDDSTIRGVILRIDSPGGDGVASDNILHEVKILSTKKPLVISMSDTAASGGYYVASSGDPILAYPNTLTGSIGVIFARFTLHGLYDKIGIDKQFLTRGRYAGIDSDYATLTEDEQHKIGGQVDSFYHAFVNVVAAGRKKNFDQIEPLAQGRVWVGAQAKQNGLVDALGGLDQAVEMIRQRAHIPVNEGITLVPYPGKRSIFEVLFNRQDDSTDVELKMARTLLGKLPIQALVHGGYMKLMPYTIDVH